MALGTNNCLFNKCTASSAISDIETHSFRINEFNSERFSRNVILTNVALFYLQPGLQKTFEYLGSMMSYFKWNRMEDLTEDKQNMLKEYLKNFHKLEKIVVAQKK